MSAATGAAYLCDHLRRASHEWLTSERRALAAHGAHLRGVVAGMWRIWREMYASYTARGTLPPMDRDVVAAEIQWYVASYRQEHHIDEIEARIARRAHCAAETRASG